MAESETTERKLEDRVRGGTADSELDREITDLIFRDDLTGLYNRRFLRELFANEVDWSEENPSPFSILMIDVDHFKQINYTYGHLCGDHVLVHVSQLLRASFRRTDVVIRYAGDEFIVVLPTTDKDTAFMLADRTRKRVAGFKYLHEDGNVEIAVDMSIGVASFPIDASGSTALIEQADRALYASKRAGRGMVSRATEGPSEFMSGVDVLRMFPCPELVGRKDIMARVVEHLPGLDPMPPSLVVFAGGQGVGKTRILAEIVKITHHEGITCLLERCSEANAVVPYQTMVELISQFASNHIREVMTILHDGPVEEMLCLAETIPQIATGLPEDTPSLELSNHEKRHILFNGLTNLLAAISRVRPIAILLDEFHNIDQGSLMVLANLQKNEDVRVGMFGAVPFESLEHPTVRELPLGDALASEGDAVRLVELQVSALGKEDVSEMMDALFVGRDPDDAFDEALYRASNGNPLYIEETLKDMATRGLIQMQDGRWQIAPFEEAEPPTSLDEAIREHLHKLDTETADVVASAAVIGSNFRLDVLQDITGRNEGYTLDILDRAMRASVVAPFDYDDVDQIRFVSSRVQQVSYGEQSEERRRSLHAEIARAEERKHKDDIDGVAAKLAYHFQRSDTPEKAERYEKRVRARAKRIFNLSEAVAYTEKKLATKLREGTDPLSPPAFKQIGRLFDDLCAAFDARRKQPVGSAPVVNATRAICQSLKPLLAETGVITIADKGQGLMINTVPLDLAQYGSTGKTFWDTLVRHNGSGLTIAQGVDEREIDVFLSALAEGSEVFVGLLWAAWLGENDVTHLYVDQLVRSARIIKDAGAPRAREEEPTDVLDEEAPSEQPPAEAEAPPGAEQAQAAAAPETASAEAPTKEPEIVREVFYGMEDEVLSREQVGQFSKTLRTALLKSDIPVLDGFADRVGRRLEGGGPEVQLQALELVGNGMRQAAAMGNLFFVGKLYNAIFHALNEVKDQRLFGMLVDLGCEAALNAIKWGDYEIAKKLIWAFQKFRRPGVSGSPGSRQAELGLEKLAKSDAFGLLLADIASGDPQRQNAAASLLIGFGTVAVPSLVLIIRDSDDFRTRKIAADVLKESGSEACRQLLAQLTPSSPAEQYVRILSVLDSISSNVRADVSSMLYHPEERVRRDAVRVFSRLPRHQAREHLVELAKSDDSTVVSTALAGLGDLAWPAVAAELAHVFPTLRSETLQQECCVALGKTQNPEAVPLLAKILRSMGFLGRFGGKSPELRAAAAWALGMIGTGDAIEVLRRHASDRSSSVRAAVQQALQRLQ